MRGAMENNRAVLYVPTPQKNAPYRLRKPMLIMLWLQYVDKSQYTRIQIYH